MAHDKYFAICENKCLVDITHLEHASGEYIGNGKTTERLIEIGGVGDMVLITSANGMAIVTSCGAICKASAATTVSGLTWSDVMFLPNDNTLRIMSNNDFINEKAAVYEWRRF